MHDISRLKPIYSYRFITMDILFYYYIEYTDNRKLPLMGSNDFIRTGFSRESIERFNKIQTWLFQRCLTLCISDQMVSTLCNVKYLNNINKSRCCFWTPTFLYIPYHFYLIFTITWYVKCFQHTLDEFDAALSQQNVHWYFCYSDSIFTHFTYLSY